MIPNTDKDVETALQDYQDQELRRALHGIYQCHRGMGKSVLDAYTSMLLAHVSGNKPT